MQRNVVVLLLMFSQDVLAEAQGQPDVRTPQFAAALGVPPVERARTRAAVPTPQADLESAERKGFIVGFGGGVAFKRESVAAFSRTAPLVSVNKTGAITDFKIGYAPRDQVLVYYTNQVAWGESVGNDAIGISGAGVTYMLKPTTRTVFVTGGIGGSVGVSIGSSSTTDVGLGFSLGGGYEFARHFSIGGRWMSLEVGQPKRSNVFGFTFDWLFY